MVLLAPLFKWSILFKLQIAAYLIWLKCLGSITLGKLCLPILMIYDECSFRIHLNWCHTLPLCVLIDHFSCIYRIRRVYHVLIKSYFVQNKMFSGILSEVFVIFQSLNCKSEGYLLLLFKQQNIHQSNERTNAIED